MKNAIITLVLFVMSCAINAQNFTWVKGSNTAGQTTAYGTMGVPSATTNPGGRHGCATWVDLAGNLWLFGGEGYASSNTVTWLNDLWKYDITSNQWTWIRGSNVGNAPAVYGTKNVPAPTNEPGAREFMATWTDASGNFWMFGGDGIITGTTSVRLADLWRYNPTTNEWTWVNGSNLGFQNGIYGTLGQSSSSNMPGSRYASATWKDNSGNLYLFGGRGYPLTGGQGHLNDFWKYSIATNEWTWIGGTNASFQNGSYGTLNIPSPSNIPGGRYHAAFAQDNAGNFYLFAGLGLGETAGPGYMHDLWKFTVSNNSWTWLSGTKVINENGKYGTLAVPSTTNLPGGRYSAAAFADNTGKLWIFGGSGIDTNTLVMVGQLNDFWTYDPLSSTWTWMKGANARNINGTYGTVGVTAPSNMPGSRGYNDSWKDNTGKLWLFGGEGYDISNSGGDHMNDLWGYSIPCNPDSITMSSVDTLCNGSSVTFTAHNTYSGTVSWYLSPTATTAIGTGTTYNTSPLTAIGSTSVYTYYAETNSCSAAPRTAVTVTVNPLPQITISGDTIACAGKSILLTGSGAHTYTWITNAHTPTTIVTPPPGKYLATLLGTSLAGCESSDIFTITIFANPVLTISSTKNSYCAGAVVTLTATGANSYSWSNSMQGSVITLTTSKSPIPVTLTVTGIDQNTCSGSASKTITLIDCNDINEVTESSPLLHFYPNPTQKNIIIESDGMITVTIFNNAGQLVFDKKLSEPKQKIDLDLPAGVYQLRAISLSRIQTFKLVIN